MARPQIPTEILLEVVKHLSASADQCSAALTCAAFRDEAQQILFHTPVPRTAYRHLIFIDAILSSPNRLGPMVKIFVHVSGSAYCDGEDKLLIFKTTMMLQAMCNLKRLAFRNAKKLPASVLDRARFQLDAFDWGSAHDNEHLVHQFLPTQPGLKHLTFHGDIAPATLGSVQLCPQLQSLTGGRTAVQLFGTGNGVTHLQWMPQSSDEDDFVTAGAESELEGLHYLGCSMSWGGLPRFSNKLRSLVLLEITGDGLIVPSKYEKLQVGLEGIPTLRVLILVESDPVEHSDFLCLGHVARNVFAWCPYLEHLDISLPFANLHRQLRRFHRVEILEGIDDAGIVVEAATVYKWKCLSNFGESSL